MNNSEITSIEANNRVRKAKKQIPYVADLSAEITDQSILDIWSLPVGSTGEDVKKLFIEDTAAGLVDRQRAFAQHCNNKEDRLVDEILKQEVKASKDIIGIFAERLRHQKK